MPCRETFDAYLDEIWQSHRLTNHGPLVERLEEQLAVYLKVKHCILTCNATMALMLLAKALGLTGEVIVPSFTFVATASAFAWMGLKPIFADGEHHVDPDHVASLVNSRTSAIVGVHTWGQVCNVHRLAEIASRHGLALIFDAAHCLGSPSWRNVAAYGPEVLSLHATKICSAAEGGAILTNDDSLAQAVREASNFCFVDYDEVIGIGINGKMSELHAAFGLASLEKLPETLRVNDLNYGLYRQHLDVKQWHSNNHYVVSEVERRDELLSFLWKRRFRVRRYFYPGIHRFYGSERLPKTEELVERVMQFPTGTNVSPADIVRLCRLVEEFRCG